jgi:hypothetical protein
LLEQRARVALQLGAVEVDAEVVREGSGWHLDARGLGARSVVPW